jgi:hypothetical protein
VWGGEIGNDLAHRVRHFQRHHICHIKARILSRRIGGPCLEQHRRRVKDPRLGIFGHDGGDGHVPIVFRDAGGESFGAGLSVPEHLYELRVLKQEQAGDRHSGILIGAGRDNVLKVLIGRR